MKIKKAFVWEGISRQNNRRDKEGEGVTYGDEVQIKKKETEYIGIKVILNR